MRCSLRGDSSPAGKVPMICATIMEPWSTGYVSSALKVREGSKQMKTNHSNYNSTLKTVIKIKFQATVRYYELFCNVVRYVSFYRHKNYTKVYRIYLK